MTGHLTPAMLVVVAATVLTAGIAAALAYMGVQRRERAGAVPFAVLTGLSTCWTLAYALELAAPGLQAALFWFTTRQALLTFVPVVWLVFALQFAGLGRYVHRRSVGALAFLPVLNVWFAANNFRWGWLWADPQFVTTGAFRTLAVDFMGLYWLGVAYSYLLVAAGLVVLARLYVQTGDLYRTQVALLLVAAVPPVAGNLLFLSGGLNPVPHLDYTPYGFAVTGVLVFHALFAHGLLDLEPVARTLVIDDMDDAIIVLDDRDRVIDANAAANRLFEMRIEETNDRALSTLFPGLAAALETDALAADADEVVVERTFQDRYFEPRLTPLDDARGHRRGTLVVLRDISARRHRELALEALQTAGRDLMAAQTREAVCGRAVDAAEAALGHHFASVHLREDDELVPTAWTPEVEAYFDPIPSFAVGEVPHGSAYEEGQVVVFDDIEEFDAEAGGPLRSVVVVPVGAWGVIAVGAPVPNAFDESDVNLLEILAANTRSALDRAEREQLLRERERELARQNDRLDEFASVVSHDLRNPIGVADGFLDLAGEALAEDSPAREEIDLARQAIERAETLIDDLLAIARQGESVTATEPVDLEEAVEEAWATVETDDATLETGELAGSIAADEGRFRQILENLFRNAVEHGTGGDGTERSGPGGGGTDAGGTEVTVSVEVADVGAETLTLAVADDGPGIPDELRDRVFEHGVSTTDQGTGFGLSIVESAVEAHGWTVSVGESEQGGARFEIEDVDRIANPAVEREWPYDQA